MKLKYGLTGSIILLCSCSTTSMPANKRIFLEYEQPASNTKSYICMRKCKDIARSCEHYNMHGDAILSESFNKNKCLEDEANCLEKCDINVKIIEKKVDIFGFSVDDKRNTEYEKELSTPTKMPTKQKEYNKHNSKQHNRLDKLSNNSDSSQDKEQSRSSKWNIFKNYKRSQSFENF